MFLVYFIFISLLWDLKSLYNIVPFRKKKSEFSEPFVLNSKPELLLRVIYDISDMKSVGRKI